MLIHHGCSSSTKSQPAKVTAHSVPIDGHPQRAVVLIKLSRRVMEREEAFGK